MQSLPPAVANRVGQTTELPSRAVLADYLSTLGLEGEFGDFLWSPVSRAHDNDLAAPMARYFVIHDTSGPNFGHRSFPDDIDGGGKINDLRNFECHDGWGKAHVVISRTGELLLAHDYSIPWRELQNWERPIGLKPLTNSQRSNMLRLRVRAGKQPISRLSQDRSFLR